MNSDIKFHKGQTLFPLRKFDKYVTEELDNRRENFGINIPDNYSSGYTAGTGSKAGPKQAWCRATSLAEVTFPEDSNAGSNQNIKKGFSMHSPFAFERLYGLEQGSDGKFLEHSIGLDRDGNPVHKIPNEKSYHRPAPGVTGFETETMNGEGKFRRMTLKFVCHDKQQLDYITPFFLTPGVTILVEWGWEYFNSESLVNLKNNDELFELRRSWDDWEARRNISSGNYDLFFSFITKFSYTINKTGGFDCEIQLNSIGEMIYGFETKNDNISDEDENGATEDFKEHIEAAFSRYSDRSNNILGKIGGVFANNDDSSPRVFYPYGGKNERDPGVTMKNISMGGNAWMRMDTLIDEINAWSAVKYKDEYTKNIQEEPKQRRGRQSYSQRQKKIQERKEKDQELLKLAQNTALQFDIRRSVISGHPNLKSVDPDVLLIPNPICPCFPAKGDKSKNINKIEGIQPEQRDVDLEAANTALRNSLKLPNGSGDKLYDEDNFSHRFDASKIMNTIGSHFPESDFDYYAGRLTNLYVSKTAIIDSFDSKRSIKDIVMNILNKVSDAACNIWEFDIFDGGSNILTIIDKNFPGLDDNGKVLEVKDVAFNSYTFSTMDSKSNLTDFSFNADLPDSIALQTLFQKDGVDDELTQKKTHGFFQKNFKNGKIKITDRFSFLGSSLRSAEGDETTNELEKNETRRYNKFTVGDKKLYCIAEVDDVKLRLSEANRGLMQNAIFDDKNNSNSIAYSGAIPGLKISCETLGISGIKFMNVFRVDNLPYPYDTETAFQVTNVKHSFTGNTWKTHIDAGIRPFVNFIK